MPLNYRDLNETTRQLMLEEIDMDVTKGTVYLSTRPTDEGRESWPKLLREAASSHDDEWLAGVLRRDHFMAQSEYRRNSAKPAKVPDTALGLPPGPNSGLSLTLRD